MQDLNYEMLSFAAAVVTTVSWCVYRAIRWVTLVNEKIIQQEKDQSAVQSKLDDMQDDFRQLNQVVSSTSTDMNAKNNELVQLLIASGRHND